MCLTKFKLTDQREVIQIFEMTQGYTGKIFSEKKLKKNDKHKIYKKIQLSLSKQYLKIIWP